MTIDTHNLVAKPTAEELKRQFDTDPAAFIRLVKPSLKFAYKTRSKQKNASKTLWKYETGSHTVIIANPKDVIAHTNPGQQVTTLDKPNRNRITVPGTNYTRKFGIAQHSLAGGFLDAWYHRNSILHRARRSEVCQVLVSQSQIRKCPNSRSKLFGHFV